MQGLPNQRSQGFGLKTSQPLQMVKDSKMKKQLLHEYETKNSARSDVEAEDVAIKSLIKISGGSMVLPQNTVQSEKKGPLQTRISHNSPQSNNMTSKNLKGFVPQQKPQIEKSLYQFVGVDLSNELEP